MNRSSILRHLTFLGFGAYGVAGLIAGGMTIASDDSRGVIPVQHDKFGSYVDSANQVFGSVAIGESCDGWPDRTPDQLQSLVVLPATNHDGPDCVISGWTYNTGFAPTGLPESTIVWEGLVGRVPIFDDEGKVVDHFSSPEMGAGFLTDEQRDELGSTGS